MNGTTCSIFHILLYLSRERVALVSSCLYIYDIFRCTYASHGDFQKHFETGEILLKLEGLKLNFYPLGIWAKVDMGGPLLLLLLPAQYVILFCCQPISLFHFLYNSFSFFTTLLSLFKYYLIYI